MSQPNQDWEAWLHGRLRALPDRRAPKNLIPSVLQKIAAIQSPVWWRRPWFEWPVALQVASGVLLAGVLASAFWWQDSAVLFARQSAASWLGHLAFFKVAWAIAQSLLGLAQYLLASIKTTYWIIVATLAGTLYLALVAIGGLFCRVATAKP